MSAELLIDKPNSLSAGVRILGRPAERDFKVTLLLALAHLPLGIVLYNSGPLAILHPLVVFGFGMFLAVKKQVAMANVVLVVGYIIGAEVLWRMAGIPVFWESGKYMSAAILVVALVRRRRFQIPMVPLAYFAFLLPSCVLALVESNPSSVIATISFNMSGPMLLVVSCWFFQNTRLRPFQFKRMLIAVILPLLSIALTTLFYTVTSEDLQFTGESNLATSGGFGPNQVSSMLGLGVFLSLTGFILFEKRFRFSSFFGISSLFLAAMSVMTFSRGGLYNAIGGIIILSIFQFRDVSTSLKRLAPVLILGTVFILVIFPYLNAFTDGALGDRFEDTGTTNRWEIMQADTEIFLENPLFGVGVGEAYDNRKRFLGGVGAVSHTEFTRLLSEHGAFGLAALAAFAVIGFINLRRPNSRPGKAFIAGAIAWSFFFMMNAGMRLAAPSLMLGLAYVTIASLRMRLPSVSMKESRQPVKMRFAAGSAGSFSKTQ